MTLPDDDLLTERGLAPNKDRNVGAKAKPQFGQFI